MLAHVNGGSSEGIRNLGVAFVLACMVILFVCYEVSVHRDRRKFRKEEQEQDDRLQQ